MMTGAALVLILACAPLRAQDSFETSVSEGLRSSAESAKSALSGSGRGEEPSPAVLLRVLSFNINGLPTHPKKKHERYKESGKILAKLRKEGKAPHLVAIQEAFHGRTKELSDEAGYPHIAWGAGPGPGKLMGSGLLILSEYPLDGASTTNYQRCAGWDCFANKGALHVRVRVPGLPESVDFYDTHLNADGNNGADPDEVQRARDSQIAALIDFAGRTRKPGAPLLFAADFNFQPGFADYEAFSRGLSVSNAAEECSVSKDCGGDRDAEGIWKASVDHHFFAPGSSPGIAIRPTHIEQTFKDPVGGQPLSDHLGLEAHYLLSR